MVRTDRNARMRRARISAKGISSRVEGKNSDVRGWRTLKDTGSKDDPAAIVVKGNGEGEDAPCYVMLVGFGDVEEASTSAINIRFACEGDGLEDVAPVAHERWHLVEDATSRKPVSRLPQIDGGRVVAMQPNTVVVEDLNEYVGTDGERDAGVEEVACVDNNRSTATFGLKGTEGGEKVFDGAIALEKMHVFDTAKVAVESGRENDDGDVGMTASKVGCYIGAKLSCSQVIVEDGNINFVEELGGFFDGGGWNALVAVLAEDGGPQMQVGWLIIQQEHANVGHTSV
jgi:hypothetical protein